MLLEPERVIFKIDLATSVSQTFVSNVRTRMMNSLTALLGRELHNEQIEERITGAFVIDEPEEPVRSFFNIPLVIDGRPVGLLTVAHTKAGLYKEEEMTILYKIVNQASHAVTKLEQVVKTEQAKLNAMVESMKDGVLMTDMDYRVVVANPSVRRLFKLDRLDEITIFDFIDKLEGVFNIRGKLEEVVTLNRTLELEDVVIEDRVYQIMVSPVQGSSEMLKGKILGGVVIFHDVTHEREVEKMRKDFTSMMVHELRSPLDSIKKIGEMMRGDEIKGDEETYDEYVKMIYKSSSHMLELVNDLLDVSKIESGKFELSRRASNIKQIIRERIRFFDAAAKDAHITLGGFFGSDIPEDISFDPIRISQVLNNMISNAIKFTQAEGRVTIQSLVHRAGQDVNMEAKREHIRWFLTGQSEEFQSLPDCLVVAVTDTGDGISEKDIPKLFNKFQQVGSSLQHEAKGTGLGLVIMRGIVEAHGGTVGVGSEEGVGTTFYFTINL
jgi:signal transduction histidine kinase